MLHRNVTFPFLSGLRLLASRCPVPVIGYLLLLTSLGVTQAAELSKSRDCLVFELDDAINPELTNQENIDMMNDIFMRSVNSVKHCDATTKFNGASGGSTSGGSGVGGGQGIKGNSARPSGDLSGTEPTVQSIEHSPTQPDNSENYSSIQSQIDQALSKSGGSDAATKSSIIADNLQSSKNGAVPEDIPQSDNDSAFEAQIRTAAENETDPEVREKLWNEYRKYKGLAVKE